MSSFHGSPQGLEWTAYTPYTFRGWWAFWKLKRWKLILRLIRCTNSKYLNAWCVFLFRRKKWFWNSVWFIGKFPTILYILCVIRFPNLEFKTQKLLTRSWQFLWWLFLLCQEGRSELFILKMPAKDKRNSYFLERNRGCLKLNCLYSIKSLRRQ